MLMIILTRVLMLLLMLLLIIILILILIVIFILQQSTTKLSSNPATQRPSQRFGPEESTNAVLNSLRFPTSC